MAVQEPLWRNPGSRARIGGRLNFGTPFIYQREGPPLLRGHQLGLDRGVSDDPEGAATAAQSATPERPDSG
eukprot:2604025-Alexandrium_andersonii.AAC.1